MACCLTINGFHHPLPCHLKDIRGRRHMMDIGCEYMHKAFVFVFVFTIVFAIVFVTIIIISRILVAAAIWWILAVNTCIKQSHGSHRPHIAEITQCPISMSVISISHSIHLKISNKSESFYKKVRRSPPKVWRREITIVKSDRILIRRKS